eukprot:TRINITY_DN77_c0_g1_i5.p1 TRINITY_DN77_c0_g1~~TRINITY_DN77_c0_g1_i5.p1  ORF type:complete len:246 (-),score=52.84 TRINITY_DN77_c0_g1_i5:51-737(-)
MSPSYSSPRFSSSLFFAVLLLSACLGVCTATPPQVLSATYDDRENDLLGSVIQATLLQLDFDQDIYYPENWVCPCIDNLGTRRVHLDANETIKVPQSASHIEVLQEGVWLDRKLDYLQEHHYKIDLKEEQYAAGDLPILVVSVISNIGEVNAFVANNFFPSSDNSQWHRSPDENSESIWICPYDPEWRWDYYYVTIAAPPFEHSDFIKVNDRERHIATRKGSEAVTLS